MKLILNLAFAYFILTQAAAQAESLVLTQAVQVLKLSLDQAKAGMPVRLRGVVISGRELDAGTAEIVDEKGGVFIRVRGEQTKFLTRSNLLEVNGVAGLGEFAPIVVARDVRVLGKSEIPQPRRVNYEDLLMGQLDSQWVEMEGRLRSCVYLPTALPSKIGGTELELATGGGRLAVEAFGREITPDLVDGTLQIRGVCFHKFNQKHQFYQMYLLVPEGETVIVKEPPVARPFDLPLQDISSLLQFAQSGNFGHRVRVQGIVTHCKPGEFIYIHDHERGLFVRTLQDTPVMVGDEVAVVGFPAQGDYSPIIEDAVFEVLAHGKELPAAITIRHLSEAFEHDAEIIMGRAKLLGLLQQENGWILSLQMDSSVSTAFLQMSSQQKEVPQFETGSEIEFAGICAVVLGPLAPRNPLQSPQSIRVLLRSARDLRLIQPPPWWTPQRILIASSFVVTILALCITGVIIIAKTRLEKQRLERRQAETEFAAILQERNRLAREIHDTLAQDISGISAQLEVARKKLPVGSEAALTHLKLAHDTARNSLQEARRTIWNMRSQVLENRDLGAALTDLLEQESRNAGITPNAIIHGETRRLPSAIENDLLRVGQEAIHNAIRHARPTHVTLELTYARKCVLLAVKDDGCGFSQKIVQSPGEGDAHFGLKGMEERVRRNGGQMKVHTVPGHGTEIKIELPLI
jgi:signal transduction histidine kinase